MKICYPIVDYICEYKPPTTPTTNHTSHGSKRMSQTKRLWAGVPDRCWGAGSTHIDEVVLVADEQVAQDASLIEIPQADHVLHAVDRCGVHGLDVCSILQGDPVFLWAGTGLVSGCSPGAQAVHCWVGTWEGGALGLYMASALSSSAAKHYHLQKV